MMTFRDIRLPLGVCLCFLVCRSTISTSTDNPTVCDFDQSTLCGYSQDNTDNFDWTRYSGTTTTLLTGPNNDHTKGNSTGHYMYIETSAPRLQNDIARLISPSYQGSETQCLQFWYSMNGQDINTLNVYVTASGQTNNRGSPSWTLSGHQGGQWKQAKVTIFPTGNYQIVFEGIRGTNYHGDIAIDDIMVTIGDCNCTDNPTVCDFDQGTLCGYLQDNTDNFDWTWHSGTTTTVGTGPNYDHTTGNSAGHFMYIETSTPRLPNDIARLISPSYQLKGSGTQCLQFWYSMYGQDINKLNVYVTASGQTNNRGSPAWTLSGNQGNQWKQAKVTIFPTGNYQIVFEGIRGTSYHGDIAIDDIMVTIGDCNCTDCQSTPLVSNGIVSQKNSTSVFHQECLEGYRSTQDNEIRCPWSGNWTFAECRPVDCGPWSGLANSSVNQIVTYLNSTFFGAIVLMTCDAGFHVFNDSSSHTELAVCTLNGTWSPSTYSQCIPIDCGVWSSKSSVLSHQKIIYTNATLFGSEVVMTCNQGYHMVNTNKSRTESAVCQENGTWSTKTYSECVPTDCGEWSKNSSVFANQNIIYPNSTTYGSEAVMTCNPGYHVVNETSTRSESAVCTENVTWSTQTFSDCIPIDCGRLPNPSNGYVLANATTYESTATIKCHIGYILQGCRTSSCGINGEWSSTDQTCSIVEETKTTTIDSSCITDVTTSKNKVIVTTLMNTKTMSASSVSHLGQKTQSTIVDTTYEKTAKSNTLLNIIVPSLIVLLVIISIIVVILVCQQRIKKTKNRKQSNATQDSTYCTISTPRNEDFSYSSLHNQSGGGLQEIIPMTISKVQDVGLYETLNLEI